MPRLRGLLMFDAPVNPNAVIRPLQGCVFLIIQGVRSLARKMSEPPALFIGPPPKSIWLLKVPAATAVLDPPKAMPALSCCCTSPKRLAHRGLPDESSLT